MAFRLASLPMFDGNIDSPERTFRKRLFYMALAG
jgi:hypothetical protein